MEVNVGLNMYYGIHLYAKQIAFDESLEWQLTRREQTNFAAPHVALFLF